MADTVDTLVLRNSRQEYTARFTNVSDGTGEAAVIKVDISTLIGPNGLAPTSVSLCEIHWSIQGFSSVRLFWDHDTNDEMVVLAAGNGYINYRDVSLMNDPKSAGGTGDVLFTTAGAAANATYNITAAFRLCN
jgi:hypothetical protein